MVFQMASLRLRSSDYPFAYLHSSLPMCPIASKPMPMLTGLGRITLDASSGLAIDHTSITAYLMKMKAGGKSA